MVIRPPALLGLFALTTLLTPGCKNLELDVQRVETLACQGDGCSCAGNLCRCQGGDCALQCPAECTFTCSGSDTESCEVASPAALQMTCANNTSCEATGGDGSEVTCTSGADCVFTVGADSRATCDSTISTCTFTVGAGSQVDCGPADAECNVTCAGPDCWLNCRGVCDSVTCDGGQAPMECINGLQACGESCPEI